MNYNYFTQEVHLCRENRGNLPTSNDARNQRYKKWANYWGLVKLADHILIFLQTKDSLVLRFVFMNRGCKQRDAWPKIHYPLTQQDS
jgi:hypothetical protein